MTQEIYVTEINRTGIVIDVQGSLHGNYSSILPQLGDNVFELKNTELSNVIKKNEEKLFIKNTPFLIRQIINDREFQLTILNYRTDTISICWQVCSELKVSDFTEINEQNNFAITSANERNESLSFDFIDSMSLPIFELAILPQENYQFEYANHEMMLLFPKIDLKESKLDIRIIFSSINYADKENIINSLKNIDTTKTWSCEFRIHINQEVRWFKGSGHFSNRNEDGAYTLRAYLKDISDKKELSSSSALLEFAFRNAVTPIYFVNKDASFYDFNDAANNSLGYTREELMGMKIHDFDPLYEPGKWNEYWTWIKSNRSSTLQTVHRKKEGSLFDVLIVSNLINYYDKELVCAYIFDLTEKNKLESEIKLCNYSFKNLHTAIHVISKEGRVIKYNPAAQALLGYSESEYQTLHIHDIDPIYKAEDWPFHWEELKKIGRITINTFNKKRDGTIISVEINANFIIYEDQELIFAFFSDITKRVAEEERLRLLESVIVNTNDAILITEANPSLFPGPKIMYVNEAFTKLTGYTFEEVVGKTPRILQNSNTNRQELDRMKDAIIKWETCEITVLNQKKNGEEFWNNIHIIPVANEKGWFTHWVAIQRDVTKHIESDREREHFLEELIAKNKKLKQFTYITTHNLRAPLTNLLSASRMMKTETISNSLTKTLVEIFKKSSLDLNDSLNTLMNALLIQDNEHVVIQKLSFSAILESVISKNSHLIADNCCLISSDFSEIDVIHFNIEYLESIFQNLITNSIKYACPKRQSKIVIKSSIIDSKTIQLAFSDNGIGMDMNLIKGKIFGLNQRFHDHQDSKGIGLYLVHEQLAALGGTISVMSEVQVGSTFYINFKKKINV